MKSLLRRLLLCPWRARYLQTLAVFHNSPRALPQFLDERGIVLLNSVNGVPEKFCHIVGGGPTSQKVNREGVSESMRVRGEHSGPTPESQHLLVQPRPRKRLASDGVDQYPVLSQRLSLVAFDLESKEQFLVNRQDHSLASLQRKAVYFTAVPVDFPPHQANSV